MILEALCFFYVLGFERKSPRTLKAKDNCLKFFFILEVVEMFWSLSFDLTSIFVVFFLILVVFLFVSVWLFLFFHVSVLVTLLSRFRCFCLFTYTESDCG